MRSENSVAKKERDLDDYLTHLYVHANEIEHFTLFSGISVQLFLKFANLSSLLLLKHRYEDASFNIHTQMDFIGENQFGHFLKESSEKPTSLCFLDFSDERRLNLLTPQEQAELLYIAHKKEAFRSPFYHHLQNRFVYLTDEDEHITKIYFRDIEDFYGLIADLFNQVIKEKTKSTAFWRKRIILYCQSCPLQLWKGTPIFMKTVFSCLCSAWIRLIMELKFVAYRKIFFLTRC